MQKTKISVVSNIMLNIHPGVEVDAIIDGENVYLLAMSIPNVVSENHPEKSKLTKVPTESKPAPAKNEAAPAETAPAETKSVPQKGKIYTEDELKDLVLDAAREIAEGMGIDVEAEAEKAGAKRITNKFIRELILEAQKETSQESPEEEEEDDAITDEQIAAALTEESTGILNALDSGEMENAPALEELNNLVLKYFKIEDDLEKKEIKAQIKTEVVDEFFENQEIPIDALAKVFVAIAFGDPIEDDAVAENPYEGKEEVSAKDLKKGDSVAVFWNDGQGWNEGVVQSVSRRTGPQILYSDGEVAAPNEFTTKFVLL